MEKPIIFLSFSSAVRCLFTSKALSLWLPQWRMLNHFLFRLMNWLTGIDSPFNRKLYRFGFRNGGCSITFSSDRWTDWPVSAVFLIGSFIALASAMADAQSLFPSDRRLFTWNNLKKKKKPARGQAPLTPVVPFRQSLLDEENFVCLGKLSFYDQHQVKVSDSDL